MIQRISLLLTYLYCLLASSAYAQSFDYAYEERGPTTLQNLMTSPAASLMMFFVGSLGMGCLFFSSEKESAEKQKAFGAVCILLVIFICYYRFSLWNDPNFNAPQQY